MLMVWSCSTSIGFAENRRSRRKSTPSGGFDQVTADCRAGDRVDPEGGRR